MYGCCFPAAVSRTAPLASPIPERQADITAKVGKVSSAQLERLLPTLSPKASWLVRILQTPSHCSKWYNRQLLSAYFFG